MTRLEDRLNTAEAWIEGHTILQREHIEALNLLRDFREMLHTNVRQGEIIDQLHEHAREREEKNERQANLIVQMRDRASENVERMHELVTENASLKEQLDKQGIRMGELREQRQGSYEEGFRLGVEAEREAQKAADKGKARTVDPWQDAPDVQAEVPQQYIFDNFTTETGYAIKIGPEAEEDIATQAENPVEYRILDAYQTGVLEGIRLGHNIKGRF